MNSPETVELFRPVGQKELDLVRVSGWKRFPQRLSWQAIFYPVLTVDYAVSIASEWNTKDANSGYVGYVLRFHVLKSYIDGHEIHEAGGKKCREYWIPADEIDKFNDNIVGMIEVIHEFRPEQSEAP
jgi:hypothetical protein